MGIDHDVTNLLPTRVQKRKASGSLRSLSQLLGPGISNDHTLPAGVIANVVGVVRQLRGRDNLKRCPIVDLRDAVKSTSDEELIVGSVVEYPLWLTQICNGAQEMSGFQINHLERVIVNGGHEQTLAFHVHAQVIDASFDTR